ncbi:MAG: CBS domain-containing protein [Burkholderiales bacterium]|nr:CBS domain-containing protein [Burkholderiales bacterium]
MFETQEDGPSSKARNLLAKLSGKLFHELPESKTDLLEILREAKDSKLVNEDAFQMIEGVLEVMQLRADDIMVPRTQMKVIDIHSKKNDWVRTVIDSGHSRYPVIDGDRDNVVGILHAKDLLHLQVEKNYDIRKHLREPVFVPESKLCDVLLKEFRQKKHHMALVVDEFGSISGLITIEDVLEEIVGEIDDEFDVSTSENNFTLTGAGQWKVKASTRIEDFNEKFGTNFSDTYYDSVGGLISDELEHVPHVGDKIELKGLRFKVLKAVDKQAQLFQVEKVSDYPDLPAESAEKSQ